MKFGFLIDNKSITFDEFQINPVENFDHLLARFYETARVSNGWFYGPEQNLKKSLKEEGKFSAKAPSQNALSFRICPTHEINSNFYDEDHLKFLVLGYGFLQGLYLIPEGQSYIGKVAYELGKLNGLILCGNDHINGIRAINEYYLKSTDTIRNKMFTCIHWHLISQTYPYEWDQFDAQYKALDGLYRISGLKAKNHANRPVVLIEKYGLKLPSWAKLDQEGKKSFLSAQRNELVHEAKYSGHPIGYSYPEENYTLELTALNTKLIAAMLGIKSPYLSAEPNNRCYWGWDIQTQ